MEPYSARLLCSWDFPGRNTGVGCHFLLQGIFLTQGSNPYLLHRPADSSPLSRFFTTLQGCPRDLNKCPETTEPETYFTPEILTVFWIDTISVTFSAITKRPAKAGGLNRWVTRNAKFCIIYIQIILRVLNQHSRRRQWHPTRALAWRIPGMGEPGGLPSMGSHRVGHD